MGSEAIAHEAESRMGYWLRGQKGERNNCFSKIHLVGQQYQDKQRGIFHELNSLSFIRLMKGLTFG